MTAIFLEILEFHGEFYENEFYNSSQDWAFTTVYWLQKSAWKNALLSIFVFIYICTHIYYSLTNETWNFQLFRRFTSFNIWIFNFFNSSSSRKIIYLGSSVCLLITNFNNLCFFHIHKYHYQHLQFLVNNIVSLWQVSQSFHLEYSHLYPQKQSFQKDFLFKSFILTSDSDDDNVASLSS